MNPFIINESDIDHLFEVAGIEVLINDEPRKVIITNPSSTSENDERYINSLKPINRGDIVMFNDEPYIIITETINKRHAKYKALMRHCNFVIEIAGEVIHDFLRDEDGNLILDRFGNPIPITIETDPIFIPMIIDNKHFQINNQYPIRVSDNQIVAVLQDNEVNRDRFDVNEEFEIMNKNWKVINQDLTKRGLLILTMERVAS